MADTPPGGERKGSAKKLPSTVITNARSGTSREMASREKNYVITMAVRMACFACMFFVHGSLRWVVLAGAVFLPFIAVVLANQANTRTKAHQFTVAEPSEAPQLTVGHLAEDVIHGELVTDADHDRANATPSADRAGQPGHGHHDQDRWPRHDRVA